MPQCIVCRQTFLCTSNHGKLQEHVDGKHTGKNGHTFEVRLFELQLLQPMQPPVGFALPHTASLRHY